jgi:N-glycosylase/DNA lyase
MKIENVGINLENTFESGQCFRWIKISSNEYEGVCSGKAVHLYLEKNDKLHISLLSGKFSKGDEIFFKNYFDVNAKYKEVLKKICLKNDILKKAMHFAPNIRILRQDPWETLCSFIISQNNNIIRIKNIIERFCFFFGKRITDHYYAFPTYQSISTKNLKDLEVIRSGFRARYIIDAAQKIVSGEVNLEALRDIPTDLARAELMKIKGVGEKVADCTLLYAYNRLDVVPKDVWINRAIKILFSGTEDLTKIFGKYAGVAQLYIFNYVRKNPWTLKVTMDN